MADQLLAQSAIDRYTSAAYELVIEGESYRDRQKAAIATITARSLAPNTEHRTPNRP